MKAIIFTAAVILSFSASAGQLLVESKKQVIEINTPDKAFRCVPGDGGYMFTTVFLNPSSIPKEFGENFTSAKKISYYFSNDESGMKAYPCSQAMQPIQNEIKKQGGRLQVLATRELTLWTYPEDGLCKLLLSENLLIEVAGVPFSGGIVSTVKTIPNKPYAECLNFVPTGL